jgi:hypothetical protein
MLIALAILVTVAAVFLTLGIRERDLEPPEAVSPFQHLDERKARIYENLRDLQFELRLGKMSDEDYQKSKLALQGELAGVLAEVDALKAKLGMDRPAKEKRA